MVLRSNEMIKINLDYYKGEDLYSDGDIENEILEIYKDKQDITDVLGKDNRWPILYHLSPLRKNLLDWYPFEKDGDLLEVGAGCGALTELFCAKVRKVVASELSKRRAEIISHRCYYFPNLEIFVGNIMDLNFPNGFDYLTLIGVLEYAGLFMDTKQPYLDFLVGVRKNLKPEGILIVAIENKFGLKYWAGFREDHTGRLFDSLEGYPHGSKIVTFSKEELTNLLQEAGFTKLEYYYPIPDYKIPELIFSDDYLPKMGDFAELARGQGDGEMPNYDHDRIKLFNENLVFDNIIRSNQYCFFANSFLVICKKSD
jgi:SAM-dependent methyltransferase